MGISDRRAKRQLKHPERGTLRVTGLDDTRTSRVRVTGVITAPGIPATAVEHKADDRDRWAGVQELPVIVDRSDPSRFVVLWEEAEAGLTSRSDRQPAWPLSERMSAWLDTWLSATFGPGDEADARAMRESVIEALEEMGPDAVTQEGWPVFAPVEQNGSGAAFPQVSWPDQRPGPDGPR